MQDIINVDSTRTTQILFNTLFDMESIPNFYVISSSFPLACYHLEKSKDLNIENNISQPPDNLVLGQK